MISTDVQSRLIPTDIQPIDLIYEAIAAIRSMTASSIQPLSTDVVHLIAAGEVIDSLAAVVRELVENALDAAATRITISLYPGQWRVRVADNGGGMGFTDLQQAALPHSTSKIRDGRDLWRISSLGFRGEALHSLAQLAELEICSYVAGAEAGWRVSYDAQGVPSKTEAVAIAPGTIVGVNNLFGRVAARRQGLPSVAQQLRAVQMTIQQIALCHPQVTWLVEQNDREWFAIGSGSSTIQILPQLLKEVQLSDLRELTWFPADWQKQHPQEQPPSPEASRSLAVSSGVASGLFRVSSSLKLLIGLPDRCHRHRSDWVKVAVNGRVVRFPELEQTVFAAFRRTLPRDRYPVCFLQLQVPPDQVDWNRHPAKAEIYLHQLEAWQTHITDAINEALRLHSVKLPASADSARLHQLVKASEAQGVYRDHRTIQPDPTDSTPVDSLAAITEPTVAEQPQLPPFNPLRAIAQVHDMYILAEHPTGIWLVEQHIAHERVLYEQLRDRWQVVLLDPPLVLNRLTPAQVEQLQRIGLEVEPFGEQLWAVRTAPAPLAQREDCLDALWELSLGGDLEAALVATACRTAIRNGMPLNLKEMQSLLDQWQQTHHPRTCPHGRPIYLTLEETSLSRFFRRHWVIGKSHGV